MSNPSQKTALTHHAVLVIAAPIILSNLSTPLLGLVDTTIIGQLGDAHYIGAIAIGATIFNLLFWGFGFLRMGTTGLTAQAIGAKDDAELKAALARAGVIAVIAGAALIILQVPLSWLILNLLEASDQVEALSLEYFRIRIWSAPLALMNYALLGWFIGMGRAGLALVLQIVLNGVNIALDAWFVLGLGMAADGVALGTALAELSAVLVGLWFVVRIFKQRGGTLTRGLIFDTERLKQTLSVNRDIMIRTLCLIGAFAWFTAQGAAMGDNVLAANAVLRNFLFTSAFLLDGFAMAAETLAGQAVGAKDLGSFRRAVQLSFGWAIGVSLALGIATLALGGPVIDFMTPNEELRALSRVYLPWLAAAPLLGVACYLLDGIFIGATEARDMRNMMIISTAIYFAAWYVLTPLFGNHGLWAALMVFFVARGASLGIRLPRVIAKRFGT